MEQQIIEAFHDLMHMNHEVMILDRVYELVAERVNCTADDVRAVVTASQPC